MKTRTPAAASSFFSAICLFLLVCVTNSFADGKDFTLHNQTGKEIKQIHIGPSNSERFGEDVADKGGISNGASVHITFHSSAPGNHWDVTVVFDDDSSTVWTNLDLSTINELTLSYKDSKPSATWK